MGTRGVVVGLVVAVHRHPNAKWIWLADVDLGNGDPPIRIVWGGKTGIVQPGSLVPVAPPGARLDGVKIRRRKYRGQVSNGMLCSLAELGWNNNVSDRVALLDPAALLHPGASLDHYANNGWQSIVIANHRIDWGINVLAMTKSVFSGGWRIGTRGNLQRDKAKRNGRIGHKVG